MPTQGQILGKLRSLPVQKPRIMNEGLIGLQASSYVTVEEYEALEKWAVEQVRTKECNVDDVCDPALQLALRALQYGEERYRSLKLGRF